MNQALEILEKRMLILQAILSVLPVNILIHI